MLVNPLCRKWLKNRGGRVVVAVMMSIFAAAGCAPKRQRISPPVAIPGEFAEPGTIASADQWWLDLEDRNLNVLMDQALSDNMSLKIAWDRVDQARAVARQAGADLYPSMDLTAGGSRINSREDGVTVHRNSFSLGLVADYEVDLWGRIRASRDAAALDVRASEEDLMAAFLTLSAQVASVWYGLAEQYGQQKLLEEQTLTNEKVLQVVTLRFRRGQASAVDVLQQRQLVESRRGEIVRVQADIKVLENQLAILLGHPPNESEAGPEAVLIDLPPLPETGLPAELICRRPDILSAFYSVQAADQRVASAIADRFPRLGLSAQVTGSDEQVGDLFDNWLVTIGANLLGPVIDGGRRKDEVTRTRAVASEALHNYGQVILNALGEVEDALVLEKGRQDYIRSLDQQLRFSGQAIERVRDRYTKGAEDYLRVLDALLTHQQLQRTRLTAEREIIQDRIDLCRALGGGWQMTRPMEMTGRGEN